MDHPFPNMEIQTTGVMLLNKAKLSEDLYYNIELLKRLRVNTVSLSISDLFSDKNNSSIIGIPTKLQFELPELINFLKKHNFNIRLSLNMLNNLDDKSPESIFNYAKRIGADQISFKKMYYNEDSQYKQNDWIRDNKCKEKTLNDIKEYVKNHGRHMYTLEFGAKVYSVNGLSTVVVDDCMAVNNSDIPRYIILRENGKLYCHWDDEGSLIF
jgi:hypothetical protein